MVETNSNEQSCRTSAPEQNYEISRRGYSGWLMQSAHYNDVRYAGRFRGAPQHKGNKACPDTQATQANKAPVIYNSSSSSGRRRHGCGSVNKLLGRGRGKGRIGTTQEFQASPEMDYL